MGNVYAANQVVDTTKSPWEKSSEWKRFDWVDIGLDLVNIFFKQNDQEIRGILARSIISPPQWDFLGLK
jgi:hypothetical protein